PTVQVDLGLPTRFDVTYIAKDGSKQKAIMVHRAVLGSMERFCGGLIEHYAGAFPLWLAPTQAVVLPLSDRHRHHAEKIDRILKDRGMRVKLDDRSETINYRIREAQMEQVPYMLVVGDKEIEADGAAVRHRRQGDLGIIKVDELVKKMTDEI